jgi:hypothetical protein
MNLTPEIAQKELTPVVAQSKALVISTPNDYEMAAEGLKTIKGYAQRIDKELIEPWRKQKASAEKERKRLTQLLIDPLLEAERILKRKQIDYTTEQERIRRTEQLRLQAEAEAKAAKERERLRKAAEKLKTEELRQARMEEAEAIVAPVIEVVQKTPDVKGQNIRTVWKAKITDPRKAIVAILQWPDYQAYISINIGELNRFANRTKGMASGIEGIEFYEDKILFSTSR